MKVLAGGPGSGPNPGGGGGRPVYKGIQRSNATPTRADGTARHADPLRHKP